jgi:hypothetical protein
MAREVQAILDRAPRYAGSVLTLDLLHFRQRRIRLSPRPDCRACGARVAASLHAADGRKIDSPAGPP